MGPIISAGNNEPSERQLVAYETAYFVLPVDLVAGLADFGTDGDFGGHLETKVCISLITTERRGVIGKSIEIEIFGDRGIEFPEHLSAELGTAERCGRIRIVVAFESCADVTRHKCVTDLLAVADQCIAVGD